MNVPRIHGTAGAFSASKLLEAVGERIAEIRKANSLTWSDVGAAFGKSDDVAASYAAGLSDMPLSAYIRGTAAMGEAFGDVAMSFAGFRLTPIRGDGKSDAQLPRPLMELACKIMAAIESGQRVDDAELEEAADEILEAGRVVDELRNRLAKLGIGTGA